MVDPTPLDKWDSQKNMAFRRIDNEDLVDQIVAYAREMEAKARKLEEENRLLAEELKELDA